VLEVLYHYAKFGVPRISPAARWPKTLSFLFVRLSVRRAFECQRFRHEGVGVRKRF